MPRAAIYLTTGPSGAGKDTLLLGAREALVVAGDTSVEFLKRDITRAPDKVTEVEVSVTDGEFSASSAAGQYALEWAAHATRYAIRTEDLERGIAAGKRMVLNVSRSVIARVLDEYGEQRGLEVYCINITASEAVLRGRLQGRGRETPAEVESRIARALAQEPKGEHVLSIVNEGTVAQGTAAVLRALRFGRHSVQMRRSAAAAGAAGVVECSAEPSEAVELVGPAGRRLGLLGAGAEWHLARLSAIGVVSLAPPAQLRATTTPRHDDDVAGFRTTHPHLAHQLVNRSKVCASCGKHCAVTLAACNGCGADLASAAETETENVPMAFVYGIARGARGPLCVSLRYEDESTLVYDDPLARASCHLNAVPADVHLRDWRSLLRRPAAARELLGGLQRAAAAALERSFYADEGWRGAALRPGAVGSAAELHSHAIAALSAVPSQYQLHLHYIVPPLLPADYHSLLRGERFSRGRWLPLEYVEAALDALAPSGGLDGALEMSASEIFTRIEATGGPSYNDALDAALARYAASHEQLANWAPECFDAVITAPGDGGAAAELTPLEMVSVTEAGPEAAAGATQKFVWSEPPPRESAWGEMLRAGWASLEGFAACSLDTLGELGLGCGTPRKLPTASVCATRHLAQDKRLLSAYGAPRVGGQPAPVGYYGHARAAGDVLSEAAWDGVGSESRREGLGRR